MDCKGIIEKYLKDNGFDGLVQLDAECGCKVADLIPCGGPFDTCLPGYRGDDPSGECDWLIYATKEAASLEATP